MNYNLKSHISIYLFLITLLLSTTNFGQTNNKSIETNFVTLPKDTFVKIVQPEFLTKIDSMILGKWNLKKIITSDKYNPKLGLIIDTIHSESITIYKDSIKIPENERFYRRTLFSYQIKDRELKMYFKSGKKSSLVHEYSIEECSPSMLILRKETNINDLTKSSILETRYVYKKSDFDNLEFSNLLGIWYIQDTINNSISLSKINTKDSYFEFSTNKQGELLYSKLWTVIQSEGIENGVYTTVLDGVYLSPIKSYLDSPNNLIYIQQNGRFIKYKYEFLNSETLNLQLAN